MAEDDRAEWVRGEVDGLIAYIRAVGDASGPETKRLTALAITSFEEGGMWAAKAFAAEDYIEGDDGGSVGPA